MGRGVWPGLRKEAKFIMKLGLTACAIPAKAPASKSL